MMLKLMDVLLGGNCFREKYPKFLHKEGLAMYKTYVKNQSLVVDDKVSENTVDNLCFFFKVQIMY